MANRRPGRCAAAAMIVAAAAAAGCAQVPTGGAVQQVGSGGSSQEQVYSQPIPVGPGPGWSPTKIVSGFLAASASFADNHAIARQYLDSTAQEAWRPGWAVTVVSAPPTVIPEGYLRQLADQPQARAKIKVTGLPVATLTSNGQYLVSSGPPQSYYYYLIKDSNGQWRIDTLPSNSQLLLTQADFQRVYQPRNLYFVTTRSARALVPDPVFVPAEATNAALATWLVNALLQDPVGWLSGAAVTGFPAHSKPIGQVRINGQNATIDLGGKAVTARPQQLAQMAAQLVWTLGGGSTAIQSVQLQLNGRPVPVGGSPYQLLPMYHGWVPNQPGSSLYFLGGNDAAQALTGAGQDGPGRVLPVPGAAGTTSAPTFSSIAVSPDRRWVAGIAAGGDMVYIGSLSHGAPLRQWRSPEGACTSLSWDAQGDLWVAAGDIVWMLPPGGGAPIPVTPSLPPGDQVTDFRVAPDGVQVAMIVAGTGRDPDPQVEFAAITYDGQSVSVGKPLTIGSSLADPQELSWYGSDDLMVLAGSSSSAQLDEVPLNGGQPTPIPVSGGVPVSVTATSPQDGTPDIAVGLSNGTIVISANQNGFEPTRALGRAPVYPG